MADDDAVISFSQQRTQREMRFIYPIFDLLVGSPLLDPIR